MLRRSFETRFVVSVVRAYSNPPEFGAFVYWIYTVKIYHIHNIRGTR